MDPVVYFLNVDPQKEPAFASRERMEELAAGLSAARQEKIRAMSMPGSRRLSLGVGLLLARGLEQMGIREQTAGLEYRKNGKPYLKDYPELYFNLSHSGTMAMAVFADTEAGCDIEKLGRGREQVARRFFAPGEQAYLAAASGGKTAEGESQKRTGENGMESPGEDRKVTWDEAFCRIWTLKEAFIKATGEGARIPLTDFCIHVEEPVRAVWKEKTQPFEFYEFEVEGYRASLCLESYNKKITRIPQITWVSGF